MRHKLITLFLSTICGLMAFATQTKSIHFDHYSTEDGLPQYTVMSIIQDKKGFIWLGTWDGLSKFDGYQFHNYKVLVGDDYYMRSNRIQEMYEDNFGNIWLHTYDGEAHCFDPNTEKYWSVQALKGDRNGAFPVEKIIIKPSGKVWLNSVTDGCVLIADKDKTVQFFNIENGTIRTNKVIDIYEDKQLNSWLLSNNGLYQLSNDGKTTVFFVENENKNDKDKQSFFSACDIGQQIWFGSEDGRIWKFDKAKASFELLNTALLSSIIEIKQIDAKHLLLVSEKTGFIVHNTQTGENRLYPQSVFAEMPTNIVATFFDKKNNIWFETSNVGIYKFSLQKPTVKYFKVKIEDAISNIMPAFTFIIDDIHGNTWVQPRGGGFSRYNPETDALEAFFNEKSSPDWRFSNILHTAFSDRQGNLWLCTRSHGLEKIVFSQSHFESKSINPELLSEVANDVRAVYEDVHKRLWVATKDKRLSLLDENLKLIGRFGMDGQLRPDAYLNAMVYSITNDSQGNVWVGTKGDGIYLFEPTANANKYNVKQLKRDPNNLYSLSDNGVYSIFEDSKKNIWVATYGGGLNLLRITEQGEYRFINHRNNLKNYPVEMGLRLRYITENKNSKLCVGSTGGLIIFDLNFDKPEDIEYRIITRQAADKSSLSNNDIHGIYINKRNEMFLATFGGGLNKALRYDNDGFPVSFTSYNLNNGLPSDVVLGILEDEQGMLWVSSENNLSKFDPQKEIFESYAEIKRLMTVNNFSEASIIKKQNKKLVFGYSGGIIQFDPQDIANNNFQPYIALTKFLLFNKELNIDENNILTHNIDDMQAIVLKHNQNFFSITYAALDYTDPQNILYAYKLEGFDEDWNYVQKQRIANYTNLPKGKYVFRIKSTNSEGVWTNNERQLNIEVLPSFWETNVAYLLYALLIALLFYFGFRILLSFYRLKENVALEKKMSEMKLRFFTDISHEIRTPLTMITAPVDYLMSDAKTSDETKKQLKKVSQNTERMLRLVNQILDFRKIQFTHLKVQELEIALLVAEICDTFSDIAVKQNIDFKFTNLVDNQKIWVDPDCIEKIVMNLLSNAFKFTQYGKAIEVCLRGDERQISIEVHDQGLGIAPDKMKNLFTRFASFNTDKSKPSTGIGLSLIHELAQKHRATVDVKSEPGKGTSFVVSLLRGTEHFDKSVEIIVSTESHNAATPLSDAPEMHDEQKTTQKGKATVKPTVLVVEDDEDLRHFIREILEDDYTIAEASNGNIGLQMALEIVPDFIVSDIMMPEKDGIEMLQDIKKNATISHVPVVLLTAKTNIESKLSGMSYGADDYITKPFSVPYFKARISNLIEQRRLLQAYFVSGMANGNKGFQPSQIVISSHDEELMRRVMQFIEDNIDNSEFSVEELSQHTAMSRSVFFKKIKSLTGLTPVEFIRDIRMQRAAQILESGEYMVKEVSYMVGISDTKYFAKCFRAKYGLSPLEYKNEKKE